MKRLSLIAGLLLALTACQNKPGTAAGTPGATPAAAGAATPQTEEQKTLYALGLAMARNTAVFKLTPDDARFVVQGFDDAVSGAKPQVDLKAYNPKLQKLAQSRMKAGAEAEKKKGEKTLADAAAAPGAEKLPSGVVVTPVTPGTGPSPVATDTVKVNYEGKLADGSVFDSSYKRGKPATFPLRGVVPCWTQALQKMKVGEKATVTCPSSLAYGDMGRPPKIPGGAALIFTVELLEIMPKAPAPTLPGHPGMTPQGKPEGTMGSHVGHPQPKVTPAKK